MRVFINGFGRIGRSVLRAWAQGAGAGIEVVGINDIAAPEMCAYLFEFDSVFGPWRGSVALQSGALVVDGRALPLHRVADISGLDLSGVDVVPQTCSVWCAPVASHAEAMVAWLRRRHRIVIRPRSPRVVTATTALAPPMMAASAAVRVVGVALMVMGMPHVSAS